MLFSRSCSSLNIVETLLLLRKILLFFLCFWFIPVSVTSKNCVVFIYWCLFFNNPTITRILGECSRLKHIRAFDGSMHLTMTWWNYFQLIRLAWVNLIEVISLKFELVISWELSVYNSLVCMVLSQKITVSPSGVLFIYLQWTEIFVLGFIIQIK